MQSDERGLERAEEFERQQRELRITRIRGDLAPSGSEFCRTCGDPIEVARRIALPSATRCVCCQQATERNSRR